MKSLSTIIILAATVQLYAEGICTTHSDCIDDNVCTWDLGCSNPGESCSNGFVPDEFNCCFRNIPFNSCFCDDTQTGETVAVTDNVPCTVDFCDEQGQPVHLPIPHCTDFQTRLFFVPAGINPITVITNQPFEHVIDGGDSLSIEAFVLFDNFTIQELTIRIPCMIPSDQLGVEVASFRQDSIGINTARSDYLLPFSVAFLPIDQGNCEITLCSEDLDCPGNSTCIEDACRILSPRFGATALLGPLPSPTPHYVGEAQYEFANDAKGRYTFRPICCPDDQNCDGIADSGGCPDELFLVGTVIDSTIPFDIIDPLTIVIQEGDCLIGNTCTPNVTRSECEIDLGGTFRPKGNCDCINDTFCDDNNACTTDTCVDVGSLCPNGTKPDTNNCCHTNETPIELCCNPTTGQLSLRTDSNACTIDTCDPTGQPTHEPIPNCGLNEPIPTITTWGQATLILLLTVALVITAKRHRLQKETQK